MIWSFVSNKTRPLMWWSLCLSSMFYVFHIRNIAEREEVIFENEEIEKIEPANLKEKGHKSFAEAVNKTVEIEVVESFPNITPYKCVSTARLHRDISSVICVKDPRVDKFVSGKILKSGCWEKHIVKEAMRSVDNYPRAVFLDIGANIGMYTVMIAKMKSRVVAVDPIIGNLALIRESLRQAGTQNYVQFVGSPISDVAETFVPVTDDNDNQGGTRLVPAGKVVVGQQVSGPLVNTSTLKHLILFANIDTVIIKLDVEGFECRVLSPYLSNPVPSVFLPYIFLEWMWIRNNLDNNCPDLEGLIAQFTKAGYQPYDLVRKKKLQPVKSKMRRYGDLLWVHKSARPLF